MSKKVSEILNSDIQVPEIVQKKADVAFSQIQSERETNMSKKNLKVTKLFVAMAACASIIIVASTTNNYLNRPQEEKETTVAEHTTTEKENMFTMKVMAAQAEVTAQKPVAIAQNDRFGYAINGDSDMNTASYKIDMPLYCEGENIESVSRLAAKAGHLALYLLLFAIGISGYLISTADGKPISVFGWFDVPATLADAGAQADFAGALHFWLAWSVVVLSVMHGFMALKHHFIDKDDTLKRMLGKSSSDYGV